MGARSASAPRSAPAPRAARSGEPCFAEAARRAGRGGRRRGRQHPPLRPDLGQRRRAPARARPRRDRRGPPARGHHLGHRRPRARRRPLHRPGPRWPARIWPTTELLAGVGDAGADLARAAARRTGPAAAAPLPDDAGRRRSPRAAPASTRPWPRCAGITTDVRRRRPAQAAGRRRRPAPLVDDLDAALGTPRRRRWRGSEGRPTQPRLRGRAARRRRRCCSERRLATAHRRPHQRHVPVAPRRPGSGLPAGGDRPMLDVGSPFDYEAHALLYCAAHLPDPRAAGYRGGGRTTSSTALIDGRRRPHARAVHQLAGDARRRPTALRPRLDVTDPRPSATCPSRRCSSAFTADEATLPLRHRWASRRASTCPGARCRSSPSTASRSPAPTTRCSQARRERAGADAFREHRPAPRRHAARPGAPAA